MFPLIKLLFLTVFLSGTSAIAQDTKKPIDWKAKNEFANQIYQDLFANCGAIPRKKWLKKYSTAEYAAFNDLDSLGKRVDEVPIESPYADLAELIFPQARPDAYPKGNFDMCVEPFNQFYAAKNSAEAQKFLVPLKDCYEDAYKGEKLETLTLFFSCLKQLKD
jgi:hypothetical protein